MHVVSFHVIFHCIIILNNATCLSLCMNMDGHIKQYVLTWSLALNNRKFMFIHVCIYVEFYNLFIKLIKGSSQIKSLLDYHSKTLKTIPCFLTSYVKNVLLFTFSI
jgi:hypothetical protein